MRSIIHFFRITRYCFFIHFVVIFSFVGCQLEAQRDFSVSGKYGAISAGHPLAVNAAKKILERGGNAVDAAICAAFVLGVCDLSNSGLGGDGFALLRLPNGKIESWDGSIKRPSYYFQKNNAGNVNKFKSDNKSEIASEIGLPTIPALLIEMKKNYSNRSLVELMWPAIKFARYGFQVSPYLEHTLGRGLTIFKDNTAMHLYSKNFRAYRVGEKLVQKNLANTLEEMAIDEGYSFYHGKSAKVIIDDLKKRGSRYELSDLLNYKPEKKDPIALEFSDYKVIGVPPPSSSIVSMYLLKDLVTSQYYPDSDAGMFKEIESMGNHLNLKYFYLPACVSNINLYSSIAERAKFFRKKKTVKQFEGNNTTHLCVWDKSGMIVSMTLTLGNHFGSKDFCPLGFFYNNQLKHFWKGFSAEYPDNYPESMGPVSAKSPIIILKKNEPIIAAGGAGSDKIVANTSIILASILMGSDPLKAVHRPRIFADFSGKIIFEWFPDIIDFLNRNSRLFKNTEIMASGSDFFGLISLIVKKSSNLLTAVGDFRRDGSASALRNDPDKPRKFLVEVILSKKGGFKSVELPDLNCFPRQTSNGWKHYSADISNSSSSTTHVNFLDDIDITRFTTEVVIDRNSSSHKNAPENQAPQIKKTTLKGKEKEFFDKIPASLSGEKLLEWLMIEIGLKIPYQSEPGTMTGEELLVSGKGDCSGKARLIVDILQAKGIPARLVGGVILRKGTIEKTHVWNEAYIDGKWLSFCTVNNVFGEIPLNWLILRYGDRKSFPGVSKPIFRVKETTQTQLPVEEKE
ncbi:MAG: gamma-glutamyltransferase [Candidatus Riflebacteria bacterium]|nr:gamma-glutamyltransferase [Candidatus Riflebacteria bacterium]